MNDRVGLADRRPVQQRRCTRRRITSRAIGRWGYGEGTSFAAPIVSAVAALTRQANPLLTPAQVADVIRRSATQTLGTGWNRYTGAGLVNAAGRGHARAHLRHDASEHRRSPRCRRSAASRPTSLATDAVDAGKTAADGVTIGLETLTRWLPLRPSRAARAPPRCTSCSPAPPRSGCARPPATPNHNCTSRSSGPACMRSRRRRAQGARLVKLRILGRSHRKLTVSVALGKGSGRRARSCRSSPGRATAGAPSTTSASRFGKTRDPHRARHEARSLQAARASRRDRGLPAVDEQRGRRSA